LQEEPENSAANHYYIHALEASDHPEEALHSAEILGRLAPASGHMVHMPGHIFFRMGDYGRAQESFSESMEVDERYMREQHVQPDNDWNYVHNLMYEVANLMEEGKLEEANMLSKRLTAARGELESTLYVYSTRDSIARLNPGLPVALRTADWPHVIELAKSITQPGGDSNLAFLARQLACFAAGMQAAEAHDLRTAEESSNRFDAELWRTSQGQEHPVNAAQTRKRPEGSLPKLEVMPDVLLQPLLRSLSIMSLELRASVLAERGHGSEAKRLFEKAARQEKDLGYREPPAYIRPVGETQGAVMMAIGNWSEAKAGYQHALLERPRSGFALYGIANNSEKSGDSKAAAREYADFLSAWKGADPGLAQIRHAQEYIAKHDASRSTG
jgi:tetratricopeptide (TPR) repeat protein